MVDNLHDEIDFTCNQQSRKTEYPQTLETQKYRILDHKKSFFEAKIISNENVDPSDSPILATSGDDIHFIFTLPKASFFQLDSDSIQREFIQLRNRSSNDSVINKKSDFSHYGIECLDMLKEVEHLDKIINNLDKDNSRDIITSYTEDYKNQLDCDDKQVSGIIGEKKADSNFMDTKNCMEEDTEDNRNNFIAVKEHYRNTPKNISEDKILAVNISSKVDSSEIYYERQETENLSEFKGAEIVQNLQLNKTKSIGDEFLEASTFNDKYASECVENSHLESSPYQQVESDGFNFERLEDSLPVDGNCSVKIISDISNGKNRLSNIDNSTEMQISHACVKQADKMLVRSNHSYCSSLHYDDSSSIIPSTSTIFLISSGDPTFYSMKSIDSEVNLLNGTANDLEESLQYDISNQEAAKSRAKFYLIDSDKNPLSSVLRNGDGFALTEPDVDDTGKNILTYTPKDTFRKHINNMEMISNEDISLISSVNKEHTEQKTSATVFIENKDINKAKPTTYEKNKIESSRNILEKDEKLSFYILTPLEKETVNSFNGSPEIVAKRLVEEDTPHRNLSSNAVQRIFGTTDKKSNLCDMFFTKSTDVDIEDKMEKGSNKKNSTFLNDMKSDNDSDFEEYKTNTNKFLKNEDEIDCAPTRVRRLEPRIPFIESDESEHISYKNEEFSNSVIVSSSKPFNRIPILRRSFRSRSLESISFPVTKTPDKLAPGREENDSAEKRKKRLSFSGIMSKRDIKSAVVNSTWEITKAIISPEASAISKKRANSEVIRSSQALSRSKLRASMDFVKKHTKRASKVKK